MPDNEEKQELYSAGYRAAMSHACEWLDEHEREMRAEMRRAAEGACNAQAYSRVAGLCEGLVSLDLLWQQATALASDNYAELPPEFLEEEED